MFFKVKGWTCPHQITLLWHAISSKIFKRRWPCQTLQTLSLFVRTRRFTVTDLSWQQDLPSSKRCFFKTNSSKTDKPIYYITFKNQKLTDKLFSLAAQTKRAVISNLDVVNLKKLLQFLYTDCFNTENANLIELVKCYKVNYVKSRNIYDIGNQ